MIVRKNTLFKTKEVNVIFRGDTLFKTNRASLNWSEFSSKQINMIGLSNNIINKLP